MNKEALHQYLRDAKIGAVEIDVLMSMTNDNLRLSGDQAGAVVAAVRAANGVTNYQPPVFLSLMSIATFINTCR